MEISTNNNSNTHTKNIERRSANRRILSHSHSLTHCQQRFSPHPSISPDLAQPTHKKQLTQPTKSAALRPLNLPASLPSSLERILTQSSSFIAPQRQPQAPRLLDVL
mmetsp:Transcript_47186/g.117724  ORF Transcript_47186/g.117724 Transcript_47186/m.117724 type:complete len:107 (+) Transcript_47186:637-957(+)